MAGEAGWTRRAQAQLEAYLDHLTQIRPALSAEAGRELRAAADQAALRPGIARPARRPMLLERSVRRWRKLLVLQLHEGEMQVVAMYDQRQDLSTVDPFSE